MITCPNCGKENQDHYKFCLGCGARLPAGGAPAGAPQAAPPQQNPYGQQPPQQQPPGPPQAAQQPPPAGPGQNPYGQQPPQQQPPGPPQPQQGYPQQPPGPPQGGPPQGGPPQGGPPQPQPGYPQQPQQPPQQGYPQQPPAGPPPGAPQGAPPPQQPPGPPPGAPQAPMGGNSQPMPAAQAASSNMITCPKCGTENPKGFAFCGRCGHKLGDPQPATPAAKGPDMGSARTMFVDPSDAQGQEVVQQMQQKAAAMGAAPPPGPNTNVGPVPGAPQAPPGPPPGPPMGAPPGGAPPQAGPPAGQPPQSQPQGAPPAGGAALASARLVLLREDGSEGGSLAIQGGPQMLGRDFGPPFDQDAYLDPQHADITITTEGVRIDDRESVNGIYYRLIGKTELQHGDQFRVGQELVRYEDLPEPEATAAGTERMGSPNPGYWGRLCILVEPEVMGAAHPIAEDAMTIGREQGDITFPEDGYVSGTHCRVFGDDSGVYLEDLNSSNGTYMRVRAGQIVPFGSLILVGQQLFRADPG